MATERSAALDGLRGVAVLLVVAFHAQIPGLSGGFLGVSVFFTISGYLITSLLLAEYETRGGIDFKRFWMRRARRLLPAGLMTIMAVALLGSATSGEIFGAVLYHSNWQQIWNSNDYSALFQNHPPLLHYWSLAIEEQYYLVWPVLLMVLVRRWGVQKGAWVAVAGILCLSVLGYIGNFSDPVRIYYGSDTRAGEIAVGAGLAVATRTFRVQWAKLGRLLGWISSVGLAVAVAVSSTQSPWISKGGLLVCAVFSAAAVAATLSPEVAGLWGRALSHRMLRTVGVYSYGIYLYHWPVFGALGVDTWGRRGVALGLVAVLAAASYHLVEAPIRNGALTKNVFIGLVGGASAALILAFGWGGWRSESTSECFFGNSCPTTGAHFLKEASERTQGERRILVIGDSVAQVTTWGMRNGGNLDESVQLVGMGAGGCPMFGELYRWTERGERTWTEACDLDKMLTTVREWKPDSVLVMFTLSNQADVYLDGRWQSIETDAGKAAFFTQAEKIIKEAGDAGSTIYWSDVPEAREGDGTFDTAANRVGIHNELVEELLTKNPQVIKFPLKEAYSRLPESSFRDGVHLNKEAARQESRWQVEMLDGRM